MPKSNKGRLLATTETSLAIVNYINESGSATMANITDEFDLAKSTAHGHLRTLIHNGYLVKKGERYKLGMNLLRLGQNAKTRNDAYKLAGDKVEEIASETKESADFTVLENSRVITVYNESSHPDDPVFQLGRPFHMHNSASGKAALAELSDERVNEIIDQWGLPKTTENTITDRAELFTVLEEIRGRGFAYNNEEHMEGAQGIAKVVHNPDGSIFGMLSIGGAAYRMTEEKIHEQLPEVLSRATAELEDEIVSHLTL